MLKKQFTRKRRRTGRKCLLLMSHTDLLIPQVQISYFTKENWSGTLKISTILEKAAAQESTI
ncbi:hypothetical protein D3C81_1573330 [compost metagenome]